MAEAVHHRDDAIGTEEPHQLIFERDKKDRFAGVTLSTCASAKLSVNTARLVAFGTKDKEPPQFADTCSKLDVGSASRHVCGNGYSPFLACFSHNFRFTIVLFGVEHIVDNFSCPKHSRQSLRDLDACCADKHRLPFVLQLLNLQSNGIVLFTSGLVDKIFSVLPHNAGIRRNDNNIKFVDFIKLRRFGFCSTGHASELFIEAEKVLDGDRRHGLRLALNLHILLCFDSLVQTVAVTASCKNSSGKFIDNHHLTVLHHIFVVALKK